MTPSYFDHNATTPVDDAVLEAMLPYFTEKFGNPHSRSHAYGWETEAATDLAREQVADLIGASHKEILFLSLRSAATRCNRLKRSVIAKCSPAMMPIFECSFSSFSTYLSSISEPCLYRLLLDLKKLYALRFFRSGG